MGFRDGFEKGLALLDEIADDQRLADGHPVMAARADMLRRLGSFDEAAVAYEAAVERVANDQTRRFLQRRLQEVRAEV